MGTNYDSLDNVYLNAVFFFSFIHGEIQVLLKHLKFHYFRKNRFFLYKDLEFLHQNWRV